MFAWGTDDSQVGMVVDSVNVDKPKSGRRNSVSVPIPSQGSPTLVVVGSDVKVHRIIDINTLEVDGDGRLLSARGTLTTRPIGATIAVMTRGQASAFLLLDLVWRRELFIRWWDERG